MAKIVVGVDASPGAQRALTAPLYFPSQEGLSGPAVAAGERPPEEELIETLKQRVAGLGVRP